jgi:hypothetical protein
MSERSNPFRASVHEGAPVRRSLTAHIVRRTLAALLVLFACLCSYRWYQVNRYPITDNPAFETISKPILREAQEVSNTRGMILTTASWSAVAVMLWANRKRKTRGL